MDHESRCVLTALPVILDVFLDDDEEAEESDYLDGVLLYGALFWNPRRIKIPRTKDYAEVTVPSYTINDFRKHFRMTRATFETLLVEVVNSGRDVLPAYPSTRGGRPVVTPAKHLLVALWFLGNQCCIRDVSDRFDISDYMVWVVVRRVCSILVRLAPKFIKWPSGHRALTVSDAFEEVALLPGCIGAIDGTHIEVKPPADDIDSYLNRLRYYSMVLQAVCDQEMIFTSCFAGFPGSVHDARVYRNSSLAHEAATHQNILFPHQSYIVGDSAYPLEQWLMVPFKRQGAPLTWQQVEYNDAQSKTRKVIERAFRLLKCRWRKLQSVDLDIPEDYPTVIIACCVLHNVCRIHDAGDVDYFLGPDAGAPDAAAGGGGAAAAGNVMGTDIFHPATGAQLRRQQLVQYITT